MDHETTWVDTSLVLKPDGTGGVEFSSLSHAELAGVGADDHHTRYADSEAVAAMGTKGDTNPLHHDRYSDTEAASVAAALDASQVIGDLSDVSPTAPNPGDSLAWNASNNQWEPAAISGGVLFSGYDNSLVKITGTSLESLEDFRVVTESLDVGTSAEGTFLSISFDSNSSFYSSNMYQTFTADRNAQITGGSVRLRLAATLDPTNISITLRTYDGSILDTYNTTISQQSWHHVPFSFDNISVVAGSMYRLQISPENTVYWNWSSEDIYDGGSASPAGGDAYMSLTGIWPAIEIFPSGDIRYNLNNKGPIVSDLLGDDFFRILVSGEYLVASPTEDPSNAIRCKDFSASMINLNDLADVDAAAPADGAPLIWSATTLTWEPATGTALLETTGLKLDQSTPQTLTASPIFNNLTAGRIPFLSAGSLLVDATTFTYQTGASPNLLVQAANAAHAPLLVKGAASQSANLTEWQNSSGTVLSAVNKDGFLGIGISAPTSPVHAQFLSSTAGNFTLNRGLLLWRPTESTGYLLGTGLENIVRWGSGVSGWDHSTGAYFTIRASSNRADTSGSGQNITHVIGMENLAYHQNTGNVYRLFGIRNSVLNINTFGEGGSITDSYGGYFTFGSNKTVGTISNAYGFYAGQEPGVYSTGIVTNAYGAYIGDINMGTSSNHAIYTNSFQYPRTDRDG